jgi:hypothetical protein
MNTRHATGAPGLADGTQVGRGPRSRLVRRAAHAPRTLACVALLTLLLALVCATPAGAANGDPVHPRGAGAALGGLKPSKYLNGIIDSITGAASLTGPQGFVLGAAAFFIKEILGAGDEDTADDASAKLNEIGDQIDALRKDVGEEFFNLQLGKTDDWIADIRETANKLRLALDHAAKAAKLLGAAEGSEQDKERKAELRAFNTRRAEFITGAKKLVEDNVVAKLNDALTDHQEAGDQRNPEKKPALLPALRRRLAGERFLTAEVARRIRAFFEYYEWWQTRLAAVLSEYYMLGGPCLWATPGTTLAEGCTRPPLPDSESARESVTAIKANIEKQRAIAGMPAKYLGEEPIKGRAFIDPKSGYMWGVEPAYRGAAQITRTGNYSGCGGSVINYPVSSNCQLAATNQFAGYSNWVVPDLNQALSLFDGQRGTARSWLEKVGVTFDNTSTPNGTRFPGYGGGFLSVRYGLLLRDGWTVGAPERPNIFSKYTRSIQGSVLALEYARGGPLNAPESFHEVIARTCPIHQSLIPYYPIHNAPDCNSPDSSSGGFILWIRGVTAQERLDYYITPPPG